MSRHRVTPGERFDAAKHPTRAEGDRDAGLAELRDRLTDLSDRLAAAETHGLLIVLQGFDGAGKDEIITHVLSAVDPSALHVFSFNKPVGSEADHDILWRFHQQTPERGKVHVFDRSYYEEVIAERVHGRIGEAEGAERCDSINDFERILVRDSTLIVKLFLHVSKDVQAERVKERLSNPTKKHEFSAADVKDRELWDDYDRIYSDTITLTSTEQAPWYAIGADDRDAARGAVAEILVEVLEELDPQYPPVDPGELEDAGISGPEDL